MPDFTRINAAALAMLPALLAQWLPDGRREGNEYVARNPRRPDRSPGSFSINLKTGRWADFATADRGGDPISLLAWLRYDGDRRQAAADLARELGCAAGDGEAGCTLAAYAAAKRLPLPFLAELGLADGRYGRTPAVLIPYRDRHGAATATRYRLALAKGSPDRRFRWAKGARPSLYGLWRPQPGPLITLVEGESDCHTLWSHGVAALGLPGAGNWSDSRDAEQLAPYATIAVVIEPDAAGKRLKERLAASVIASRLRFVSLAPWKDVSDLYLADPERFAERWRAALAAATAAAASTAGDAAGGLAVVMPPGFAMDGRGLWFAGGGDRGRPDLRVAGPFEVVAETRDGDGDAWGCCWHGSTATARVTNGRSPAPPWRETAWKRGAR